MKSISSKLTAGALVMAVATAVYGQDASTASTNQPSTAPNPGASNASAKTKSMFRVDGTDLRIGDLPPVTFHGFASQGFIASSSYSFLAGNTRSGSFQFNEFGLNASMSPLPRTRIAAQAFSFDVGNVGNNDLVLDYGLIDYNFSDAFGVRGGRIRRQEGIYNHIQDVDLARTSILLPQGMYNARWRDFSASVDGGSFYGNVGLGKAGSIAYEFYGGVIDLSQEGGVARQVQNSLAGSGLSLNSVNDCPLVGGQIWWNTPLDGLRLGFAVNEGIGFSFDASGNLNIPFGGGTTPLIVKQRSRYDVPVQHYSVEYQWHKLTLQGEAKFQTLLQDSVTTQTFPAAPFLNSTSVAGGNSTSVAWYVGAAYEVNNWMQVGSYYTEYYPDIDKMSGNSDRYQDDLALSFRFDPKPWWIIKVESHYEQGTALLYDDARNPVRGNNGWFLVALKTTLSF